jgi:hypothetical protein
MLLVVGTGKPSSVSQAGAREPRPAASTTRPAASWRASAPAVLAWTTVTPATAPSAASSPVASVPSRTDTLASPATRDLISASRTGRLMPIPARPLPAVFSR